MSNTDNISTPIEPTTNPIETPLSQPQSMNTTTSSPLNHIDPQANIPIDQQSIDIDILIVDESDAEFIVDNIPQFITQLYNQDQKIVYRATIALRILLSNQTLPYEEFLQNPSSVIRLVELLQSKDIRIVYESLWSLTNLLSTPKEISEVFMQWTKISPFIDLLQHPHEKIVAQALWVLGNIAGDFPDEVFIPQYIPIFVSLGSESSLLSIPSLRTYVWCLSNFFRGIIPPFSQIEQFLPILVRFLRLPQLDEHILIETLWSLRYIASGDNIEQVTHYLYEQQVFHLILDVLNTTQKNAIEASVDLIGAIATTESSQYIQQLLNDGVLDLFVKLLRSQSKSQLKLQILWTISNIAACNDDHVEFLIDSNAFTVLQNFIPTQCSAAFRLELLHIVANISDLRRSEELQDKVMKTLFNGWIRPMSQSIINDKQRPEAYELYLQIIECILKYGEACQISHIVADEISIHNNQTNGQRNNIKRQINLSKIIIEREGGYAALQFCLEHCKEPEQITAQRLLDQYFR